ncbi:MFS transporter [Pseudonocardia nematodicida]|uniref:MFS transporter n=1 Tax=Pseudonocardia nematodicida TaxID=1206997 RepID=A0ABV1K9P6_9PSEU
MQTASRKEARNVRLASLGAALEYYDFVAYIYVAALISAAFFPAEASPAVRLAQTLAIYSIGFVVRPVAGIVMAHIADRIGRKRIFMLTIVMMSGSTLAIGLLPTYESIGWLAPALLLTMRVIQGCAVGGELPGAAVLVAEHSRTERVARSAAVLQSMSYGGFLLGAGAAFGASLVVEYLTPDMPSLAWRLPFLLGGVLGLVAIYLRRVLEETPLFAELQERGQAGRQTPLATVLRRDRRPVAFAFLMVFAMSMLNTVFFQYWPTYLQVDLGHSATLAIAASLITIVGAMVSMPLWGLVADRHGWRSSLGIGAGLLAISSVPIFVVAPLLPADSGWILLIALPAAFATGSIVSATPGLVASLFRTEVRQSAYAMPYNIGVVVFGGPLPLILVWAIATGGPVAPLYVVLLGALAAGVAAFFVSRMTFFLGNWATTPSEPGRVAAGGPRSTSTGGA